MIETVPIAEADVKSGFRSGVRPLDDYFSKHALENDRRGIGKAFVLRRPEGDDSAPLVLGFYTLSMADLDVTSLPRKIARGLPKYAMPVALIGRLAVDERVRGRGHGARLLKDALARVSAIAAQIGCYGIVVDAKDETALDFYARYGFVALPGAGFPRRLFIPMKTVFAAS